MEADVNLLQSAYSALVDFFFIAPKFVGNDEFTELRTPIAQVVDTHHVITERLVSLIQRASYRRSAEVTYVERFCNVYTAVIDTNGFSLSDFVVKKLSVDNGRQNLLFHADTVEKKIKISVDRNSTRDDTVFGRLLCEAFRYFLGRQTENFCKFKTRQGVIGVNTVAFFKQSVQLLLRNSVDANIFN